MLKLSEELILSEKRDNLAAFRERTPHDRQHGLQVFPAGLFCIRVSQQKAGMKGRDHSDAVIG
jgi:hypothetical protein